MDVDPDLIGGALRFSLCWSSTDDDVTAALTAMVPVFARRRAA
jgi:cysteine sulfinate desulfinase/cysteine desulfurase-like protein